jgi:hypothetical protein
MAKEYQMQMSFWKQYVSEAMVDKNVDVLNKSYEAIKGVMILPWTSKQLSGWNKLLDIIKK